MCCTAAQHHHDDALRRSLKHNHVVYRREYEVLLRKALSFQRTPAVIALYWYSTQNHVFYDNAQDDLDILARCASWGKL